MADESAIKKVSAFCTCFIFILAVILFAVSFDTLTPTEIGIKYNDIYQTIDEEHGAYNNGRYFLGLGLSFIKYPANLIEVDFTGSKALRAWSREGQLINIDLGFYYRLDRDMLVDIYKRHSDDYNSRIVQIAIRSIKEVTIQYEATDFFEQRKRIGDHMSRDLRKRMREEYVFVELFALRAVDIPDLFEAKVVNKVVKLQEKKTMTNKMLVSVQRAEITVVRGNGQAMADRAIAEAEASRVETVETAKANGNEMLLNQEALSYQKLSNVLGMNAMDLVKYRYSQLVNDVETANRTVTINVGFDAAGLSVSPISG